MNNTKKFIASKIIFLFIYTVLVIVAISPNAVADMSPPKDFYRSSLLFGIWTITFLSFIPNLFWFTFTFYLSLYIFHQNKFISKCILKVLLTNILITLIGSFIDFAFLYRISGSYYRLTFNLMKWIMAVLLIGLTTYLLIKIVLKLPKKQGVFISITIASINPIVWFLILNDIRGMSLVFAWFLILPIAIVLLFILIYLKNKSMKK